MLPWCLQSQSCPLKAAQCPKFLRAHRPKARRGRRPSQGISAILDRRSGTTSGSSNEEIPQDYARAALERLFRQAQLHEERLDDPEYAAESALEEAVNELELDLAAAFEALKVKEGAVREAEEAVKADQKQIEAARQSLLARWGLLNPCRLTHGKPLDCQRFCHRALCKFCSTSSSGLHDLYTPC